MSVNTLHYWDRQDSKDEVPVDLEGLDRLIDHWPLFFGSDEHDRLH